MRELTATEVEQVNGAVNFNWPVLADFAKYWNFTVGEIWMDIATAPGSTLSTAEKGVAFGRVMSMQTAAWAYGGWQIGTLLYDHWLERYTEFWDATFSTIEVTATRISDQGSQILQNFSVDNSHYPAGYADPYNYVGSGGWGHYGDNSGFFGHRH